MWKFIKRLFLILIILVVVGVGAIFYLLKGSPTTNRSNYERIADIPVPSGFERIAGSDPSFASYLRSLPLKPKGSPVMYYTGGKARLQSLAYAVVDMPLLSNDEQCADCCMRLRGEYLYQTGQFGKIRFTDVNGNKLYYQGGGSRKSFEKFMRRVYGVASTASLKQSLPKRDLDDIQPGDVFVYAAGSTKMGVKTRMGHAVMVVDVAENSKGERMFLLAEGNTPARDIHVMRNFTNPICSPWFSQDDLSGMSYLSCWFDKDELMHW